MTSFKGAVITGWARQDLLEIYELRELLENVAARAAAEPRSDQERRALNPIALESCKIREGQRHGEACVAAIEVRYRPGRPGSQHTGVRGLIENLGEERIRPLVFRGAALSG
jgi:hypothetical protein